ncbi:titin-like [Anopheles ziemanni]|uniref:titin-like n=1 Tax=Anopheles coustani TaxID=139045 RepID=UPI002659F691|nr:titin-like [Anopheles coustani]XP_058168885.1 titin-like [Anopheles ziemanni]
MNTEEEVPARVTRGALRRRSIDQDATPQNPAGSGTGAAGGTPKKATSTKKGSTLGAIQEAQGRPSTPVVGGRTTRRRMSESSDTPTTAPNKAVQILKDAETGTGSGRRSRNNSLTLTEENVELLNQANEGTSMGGRTRTPARLRASHEALVSTTPQTAPPAVRRSTRRNSVTSDDGSIQSLPITTPKTPVVRSLKEETIVEEDASSADRSEPETTTNRNTRRQVGTPKATSESPRRQVGTPKATSESPRRDAPSPLLSVKKEMTPTRASVSPKPRNSTPRSKNVSFSDDSKQEDHQSGYPKTPTSPGKKFVLVEVNDLRNTQLINGAPKVNAEIDLNGSAEKDKAVKDVLAGSPTISVDGENSESDPPKAVEVVKEQDEKEQKDIPASPVAVKMANTPAKDSTPMKTSESIPVGDRSEVNANNISGIEELESSMILPSSNKPKYWSNSVRGTATQPIDLFTVSKQEKGSPKHEEEQKSTKSPDKLVEPKEAERHIEEKNEEDEEDEEEEEEEERDRNELINDEAMEVDGYQSGDSLDAEVRQEMQENEILDHGEDLGSEDTADEGAADEQYENDSFIVSDDDEELDEDALLNGTGDDLSTSGSPIKSAKKATTTPRRRIIQMGDDSDEELEEKLLSTPPSSDQSVANRSLDIKRSAKRLQTTDEEASPEKKPNRQSVSKDETGDRKVCTPKKIPMEKCDDPKDTPKKIESTPTKVLPSTAETDVAKGGTPKQSTNTPGKLQSSQETITPAKSVSDITQPDTPSTADVSTSPNNTKEEGDESSLDELNSVSVVLSRKSLPASSTEDRLSADSKSEARKSLPASTKMQFTEEVTTEDLHPSSSNLDASYREQEEEEEDQQQSGKAAEQSNASEDAVDQERTEKSAICITSDEEYFETSDVIDLAEESKGKSVERELPQEEKSEDTALATKQQPSPTVVVPPVKPARKSLPAAPLISAQFYLGASKKEKRNTLGGVPSTVGATSTPNPKKTNSAKTANASSKLVANPFAMASAKNAKGRLSMDDAAVKQTKTDDQSMQKTKVKTRNSLPTKLDGGILADGANASKKKSDPSIMEEREKHAVEQDEPEPMEVDEYIEEENEQNDDGEGEGEDESEPEEKTTKSSVAKPKTPLKPKKALEDFDIESILTRCNEVVRANKERKKQLATLAQQKRDEKRRLRALREQQEKEAAASKGDNTVKDQPTDSEDETTGDKQPNATTTSNNDTTGQSIPGGGQQNDEPTKKKKKRKPKIKNYVLEEMKELKKDHVSEALLRKMEAREARKERKKAKRAAQIKQLNKENGLSVGGGSASDGGGIGAKLQKVAAKKKQQQKKEETAATEETKEQPAVRVAVSAFSVFQQLQNNSKPVNGGGAALVNSTMKGPHAGVLSEVKKGLKKGPEPVGTITKLKDGQPKALHSDEAAGLKKIGKLTSGSEVKEIAGKPSKENRQPTVEVVAKTPTADNVVSAKKSKMAAAQKAASESQLQQQQQQQQQQQATSSFENVKAKEAMTKNVASLDSAVLLPKSLPDPVQEETRKLKKSKKNKAGKLSAAEGEKDVQQFVEEKQEVAIEQDLPKSVPKEKKSKKKAQEVIPETEDRSGLLKEKKPKKKAAAMTLEVAEEALAKEVPEPIGKEKKLKKKSAAAAAMRHDGVNGETLMASAIREVHAAIEGSKKNKKAAQKKKLVDIEEQQRDDGLLPTKEPASDAPKKRKRDPIDGSTPRPTKLRALQRADHGGFVEATVTPDKTRLKRNFGFEELQATPKAVGFKVSSLLPTDELRTLAEETTKVGKLQSTKKKGTMVPEPNRALPLPVWTRSGYFMEIPEENNKGGVDKRPKKATDADEDAGYISLKGHDNFKLKTLRNGDGGGAASSSASVVKPHRIDKATVAPSVISFKRQQLLEKTAHLREKKGGRK